ncbi:hypothetical protein BDV32DRAFT_125845 [Aspergillus pseudonomiae]|nr:hypothetical protein BDV32DRAFT_125845 [Aspergillus pseudonomiae]
MALLSIFNFQRSLCVCMCVSLLRPPSSIGKRETQSSFGIKDGARWLAWTAPRLPPRRTTGRNSPTTQMRNGERPRYHGELKEKRR